MSKYIILLTLVFSVSCRGQTKSDESQQVSDAKWYYYSYAIDLKAHNRIGEEVEPSTCDIILVKSTKISVDTTKMYFQIFSKNTLNLCSFTPLDLVGISVVRNKLYLPIYHSVVFDAEKDSIVLKKMVKQSMLLQKKVLIEGSSANAWLQAEAKRRKSP